MAQPSYEQLVAALLAVRPDHATARFDQELAAAEAAGAVDRSTALTLRWWQRQSVAALEEHIAAALPQVLATLASADAAAREALHAAADAWAAAQPPARTDDPPEDPPGVRAVTDDGPDDGTDGASASVTLAPVTELPMRAPDHDRPGPGFTSHLRPGTSSGGHGAPPPRLLGSGLTVRGQARRPEDR